MSAENTPDSGAINTIVLVHGFWVTPLSWEKWIERYEERGYRVLTPTYPGFEGGVEALREDPSPIEALTFPAVIEHIGSIIKELERPPIIIGHSAGGVLTQILLDHGYGAAGVAIDSVPAEDNIMPPAVNQSNAKHYRHAKSPTDYKEFEGRSHYSVIGGEGWEEVADYALEWTVEHAAKQPPT
jgi:pimeloyl-ACP methyl ester carboxylesterase